VMLLLFSSGDALQCYQGVCVPGRCPDDPTTSLQKITCPQGHTMCMKMTALISGYKSPMMRFDCAPALTATMLGIKDGGCADPTDVMEDMGMDMGAAQNQMSDMEMCFCDTSLCNTASKKAFTTFLGFLFFFLLNIII